MGIILELRMCDSDRERFGGTEWVRLDIDNLFDLPSKTLRLYEGQTGYAIERAIDQAGSGMPAIATQVLLWLARKQSGQNRNTPTGEAEAFSALDEVKTIRVSIRRADEPEDDVDPPGQSEQPENTPEP